MEAGEEAILLLALSVSLEEAPDLVQAELQRAEEPQAAGSGLLMKTRKFTHHVAEARSRAGESGDLGLFTPVHELWVSTQELLGLLEGFEVQPPPDWLGFRAKLAKSKRPSLSLFTCMSQMCSTRTSPPYKRLQVASGEVAKKLGPLVKNLASP